MLVHSLLIESVYLRHLGGSAGGNDFFGDNFDGCPVASREKKPGPLTRKGACDSTADRTSGSVDHCDLILEHHYLSYFRARWHSSLKRSSDAKKMRVARRLGRFLQRSVKSQVCSAARAL